MASSARWMPRGVRSARTARRSRGVKPEGDRWRGTDGPLARTIHERTRPRPDGWRRGRLPAAERSGPPESGAPLEERRVRRVGDGAGGGESPTAPGPVRPVRCPFVNSAGAERLGDPRAVGAHLRLMRSSEEEDVLAAQLELAGGGGLADQIPEPVH